MSLLTFVEKPVSIRKNGFKSSQLVFNILKDYFITFLKKNPSHRINGLHQIIQPDDESITKDIF